MFNRHSHPSGNESTLYHTPFDPERSAIHWFSGNLPENSWSCEHMHPWGELLHVCAGSITVYTARGNWLAPPSRAVWIPPDTPHCWHVPCDSCSRTLWLNAKPFISQNERFMHSHILAMTPLVHEILHHLGCAINPDAGKQGRLLEVLVDLLLELRETEPDFIMPRDPRLISLCSQIIAHPGNNLTQAQWASRLGMSERNLGRLFKRQTGTSFHAWRKSQRMLAAGSRLKNGECVTTIAMECGYSSLSSFIAAFRMTWGCTPGEFAKNSTISRY